MADRVIELVVKVKDDGSKSLTGLGKAFVATTGVMATAVTKFAIDAAPLEGISGAFEGIAESSGRSADEMLDALKRGSTGMVAQRDLMMTYNQAAQLVSTTFANQLPEAMGYLGKVSAATGQDMGFMLDSLVKGVGRLSPMILDNLNVQVQLSDATARASAMFGVQADQLSKTQVQAGMMAVVMDKLRENTAAMPDVAGSAAQQLGELKATFTDLKDSIGTMALPALKAVLDVINSLNPGTLALAAGLGTAGMAALKFGGGLKGLASSLGTTQLGLVAATAAVVAWGVAWEKWQDLQNEVTKGIEESGAAISDWAGEAEGMIDEGESLSAVVERMSARVREADEAFHKDGNILEDLGAAYARNRGEVEIMGQAQEEMHGIILAGTTSWETYTATVQQYNDAVGNQHAQITALTEAQFQMNLRSQEYADGAGELRYAMLRLGETTTATSETFSWNTQTVGEAPPVFDATATAAGAAAAAEMQAADAAARMAEQEAVAQQAAIASAESYEQLATSLMGATDQKIANTLVGMLDPETMGATAFVTAATTIGTTFGTMDEKSIALAQNLPSLATALSDQVIPAESADEALKLLIADAEDGDVVFAAIKEQFEQMPAPIGEVADKADLLGRNIELAIVPMDELPGSAETAAAQVGALGEKVGAMGVDMENATDRADRLATALDKLDREVVVSVSYKTTGSPPPNIPEFQTGIRSVPQDMLAYIHQGEMLIPREIAESLRGERSGSVGAGGYGGGGIVIEGPLVGSAVVRSDRDLEELADLVVDRLRERVLLRGAY